MATFYRPRGSEHPAVLWNPKEDCAVYAFVGGVYETDDPATIKILRKMGFSEEPISANKQVAMDIIRDLEMPPAPPPPKERSVPATEPKVPTRRPASAGE